MILGGFPAELREGKMIVKLKGNKTINLSPMDISHEMSRVDTSIDEVVAYSLEKDALKSICDGEIESIELTGWKHWDSQKLIGEEIMFLLRAFWNGTFNENDFTDYLQRSPAAPKLGTQGCYIATAVYGSYDCPEVWTLRRFRDYSLDKTIPGRIFIRLYYTISPSLVRWFGNSKVFKSICQRPLDKLVASLRRKGYMDTPYCDKY